MRQSLHRTRGFAITVSPSRGVSPRTIRAGRGPRRAMVRGLKPRGCETWGTIGARERQMTTMHVLKQLATTSLVLFLPALLSAAPSTAPATQPTIADKCDAL